MSFVFCSISLRFTFIFIEILSSSPSSASLEDFLAYYSQISSALLSCSFLHFIPLLVTNRELKQRQRRRQRERHKFAYLVGKNNSFARPARAFFTFVHFFAVVSKTTTWNSQILGFKENASTWR